MHASSALLPYGKTVLFLSLATIPVLSPSPALAAPAQKASGAAKPTTAQKNAALYAKVMAKIRSYLTGPFEIDAKAFKPTARFKQDLKMDQWDVEMLVSDIADDFNVPFFEEDENAARTPHDVANIVVKKLTNLTPPRLDDEGNESVKLTGHPYFEAYEALIDRDSLEELNLDAIKQVGARERNLVNGNTRALQILQRAFQTPYREPAKEKFYEQMPDERFTAFSTLARLVILEGRVKQARGDRAGALTNYLNALQLGQDVMRGGPVISMNQGLDIETQARVPLWRGLGTWTPDQLRPAIQRLESLEAHRESFKNVMAHEMAMDLDDLKGATPAARADFVRFANAFIAGTERGFGARTPVTRPKYPEGRFLATTYGDSTWALEAGDRAQNALLLGSMAAQAYELESGHAPTSLEDLKGSYLKEIPMDPFAKARPVQLKLQDKGFRIYSIGPDGQDNGGQPADEPKWGPVRHVLLWTSKGDIVAGVNQQVTNMLLVPM